MTTLAPEMPDDLTWDPHPEPLCEGDICDLPTGTIPLYTHLSADGTIKPGWADEPTGSQTAFATDATPVPLPPSGLALLVAITLTALLRFWRDEDTDTPPKEAMMAHQIPESKTDPALLKALREAANAAPMTAEKLRQQRISFVYGNLMGKVSREVVEQEYDRIYGKPTDLEAQLREARTALTVRLLQNVTDWLEEDPSNIHFLDPQHVKTLRAWLDGSQPAPKRPAEDVAARGWPPAGDWTESDFRPMGSIQTLEQAREDHWKRKGASTPEQAWAMHQPAEDVAEVREMTDAECAERILNRHAREVAAHFDAENLHSAEDLMRVSVKRYCEGIRERDAARTEGGA